MIMTMGDMVRDEELKSDINRETAKISALSSDKIDKYKDLTVQKYYVSIKVKL